MQYMSLDKSKYKMIIRYIAKRYIGKVGKTQLYKILFFIDKEYSKKHKKTLTGDVYVKNNYGPTPKMIQTILDELIQEDFIIITKERTPEGHEKHLIVSSKEYTDETLNNSLTAADLEMIRDSSDFCIKQRARDLSEKTHQSSVFDSLNMDEEIPNYILPNYFDSTVTERKKEELKANYT